MFIWSDIDNDIENTLLSCVKRTEITPFRDMELVAIMDDVK